MLIWNRCEYIDPISYDYFVRIAEDPNSSIRSVSRSGFLYYEAGAMGFGWVYYYFNKAHDRKLYHKYLREHREFMKSHNK